MFRPDFISKLEEAVKNHGDNCTICKALKNIIKDEQTKRPDGNLKRFRPNAKKTNEIIADGLIEIIS